MSQAQVQQARAALQADPTRAQAWMDYIAALIEIGQMEEARKMIALGRQKGLQLDALGRMLQKLQPMQGQEAAAPQQQAQPTEAEVDELSLRFSNRDYVHLVPIAKAMTSRYPGFAFGWSVLGASLAAQSRFAEALHPAQMAATLAADSAAEHYNLGRVLSALDRQAEASMCFRRSVTIDPVFLEAHHKLGIGLHRQGRLAEAEASYQALLAVKSDIPEVLYNLGLIYQDQGRLHAAEASYRRALTLNPQLSDAQRNLAAIAARPADRKMPDSADTALRAATELLQSGFFQEAEQAARSAIRSSALLAEAWKVLSMALLAQHRASEALEPAVQAVHLDARDPEGHFSLAQVLSHHGRHGEAITRLEAALVLKPEYEDAQYALGSAHRAAGKILEAEAAYRKTLQANPSHALAMRAIGSIHHSRMELREALACLRRAAEIDPAIAAIHAEIADISRTLGQATEAEAAYRRTLQLEPTHFDALANLALVLAESQRYEEAEELCRKALRVRPESVECLNNLGNILGAMEQHQASLEFSRQALMLQPDFAQAHHTEGFALQHLGKLDQAEVSYRRAIELQPEFEDAHGNLLFVLNYHPDKPAEEIYEAYAAYEQQFGAALRTQWPSHGNAPAQGRRLRIGYFSPDLRQHSVRHFLEPLLASHDRSRFEVFAYAELASEDAATARYRTYCDHFILTRGMSDEALAARIRSDAIDILVDVAGHTAGNRLLVFARKPAPVSLSWLGYGYTTGLSAVDYLLTNEPSAPAGSEHLFSEAPWRLPCAYAYRSDAAMGEVSPLPAAGNGFVTFGTLTRAIRVNHRSIRVWAQILKRVPGSVLVIDSKNFQHASMQDAMAERFAQHGIGPNQLQIGCHSPPWDTLRAIDIGLDCFPHNSGTTLFETLFMGVPFVTLAGRPSVGRLGRSILTGLGRDDWLHQWCADSEEDYIDKAVALASDLTALQQIRTDLRPIMQRSALMDEAGFARSVEQAYGQMFERWQAQQAGQQIRPLVQTQAKEVRA